MSLAPADLLIRGGTVIDGTGKAPLSAALPPEVLEGDQAAVAARRRGPEVRGGQVLRRG